ncbi:MAG: hypothetical protein RR585_04730 [Coprobacillus sp.]
MKKVKIFRLSILNKALTEMTENQLEEFINNHNVISWKQSEDHYSVTYTFIYDDKDE